MTFSELIFKIIWVELLLILAVELLLILTRIDKIVKEFYGKKKI